MNPRDRGLDNARRDDLRAGTLDVVEVVDVFPHVRPYPDDQDFNVVSVRLISRWAAADREIERVRLLPAQRFYGHFQGESWTPRIGDNVLVYWLKDQEGLVLFSVPSYQQEPICRSQADREHQEFVFKLCPWEEPTEFPSSFAVELTKDSEGEWTETRNELRNYQYFPPPKNPICFKWWPKTRDWITIYDCLNGDRRPQCDRCAPCNSLDDIIARTYFKNFSDISPTSIDLPWRYKFHHNSGSVDIWDNDGTVHRENKVACETCGGAGVDGECPTCGGTGLVDDELCPDCDGCGESVCSACNGDGAFGMGHLHQYPEGSADLHAGEPHPNKDFTALASEQYGVRVSVIHPDDDSVNFAFEAIQFSTGAYVRIMKNGEIKLYSPEKITLDAPLVEVVHDLQVDEDELVSGTCSGPNNIQ